MAPIGHSATAQAETAIRDTIQSLYNVMLHTSAYDAAGSHTSLDALVAEVRILSQALRDVNEVVENDNNGSGPNSVVTLDSTGTGHRSLPSVPRDLVQYVEAGRNPDIYTREFVELVRRTNQLRAGKRGAFAQFRDTLAGQIRSALPELGGDVDRVMGATVEHPSQADERGEPHTAPGSAQPAASLDGSSKTTLVGEAETPGSHGGSALVVTATAAPTGTTATQTTANVPASASASASPLAHPGSGGSNQAGAGTPSANSDAGSGTGSGGPHGVSSAPTTIDMMGILPSTPQPTSAAGGGTASGSGSSAAVGGGAAGSGGDGGQDAMETS
ncbi:mediator complex subunit NUT2 [Sporothrix schenckii 1099-18]|uniref:Mediator of RNA polymerase II transcription subunit 10 n=2 Tax=Sporothrix schenckii TaxID=29908 RepID=U7PS10_SPOS1|nr:mediator complex subunit NUT2 [Sporothrix schenckii 1099-18]ERS97265.1 hypothetical protein HMPREF1624_06596 [Sporothrix schenckii ATCC 58251]KJR86496.1 hypothetical protein SPSK_02623 [Sporothrix schenckii 1099-18]